MNFKEFKASLQKPNPPDKINKLLEALWHDGKGDWDTAHDISQDIETDGGSWVHAYLHRKEGDLGNASYWYARAGKKRPNIALDEEWEVIVRELLYIR